MRVEEGEPILAERHFARLAGHARALGIDHPGDELISRDLSTLAARGGRLLVRLELGPGSRLARSRPLQPPAAGAYDGGVGVLFTEHRIDPGLAAIKAGDRQPHERAARDAAAAGLFEGLLLGRDGHVIDGSRTSPLLVSGDDLVILEGGLEGITREDLAARARDFGLRVRRASLRPRELDGQLLLAGTGVGLVPVGPPQDERILRLVDVFRLDRP